MAKILRQKQQREGGRDFIFYSKIQGQTERKASFKVITTTEVDYEITTWTNKLVYTASNTEEYEEDNRYEQVFMDMVNENDLKYTIDDAAMAIEVILAYYGEGYNGVGNIVMAGETNENIASAAKVYAEAQPYLTGPNGMIQIAKNEGISGVFFENHWCAMFVSYNLRLVEKRTGVHIPIKTFFACSTFWRENKNKTGFCDVKDSWGYRYGYYGNNIEPNYDNVQAGDILLFNWASGDCARHHTGLVTSVDKDENGHVIAIHTSEGNSGSNDFYSSTVKEKVYSYALGNIYYISSFVSISTVLANSGEWDG